MRRSTSAASADQVIEMQERLPGVLVDARDLVREEHGVALVVVDAGGPHEHGGNAVALLADERSNAITA